MKKIILIIASCCSFVAAWSQEEPEVNLDLLKAPASPAFNMLGIAPSTIERPTDITAFMASLQTNTGNFTSFPKNYAVEIAPFLFSKKTGPTLKDYNGTNFWKDLVPQTFQLSLGVSQQNADGEISEEEGSFPRGAVGLRVSLVRRPWTKQTDSNYHALHAAQTVLLDEITQGNLTTELTVFETKLAVRLEDMRRVAEDTVLTSEQKQARLRELLPEANSYKDSISRIKNGLINELAAGQLVTRLATAFEIKRQTGFYLDLEGGMVMDFPDRRFNYSTVSKAGLWLTGGYDGHEQTLSVLGIARYLYQPDKIFADDSGQLATDDIATFDFGGRLLLNALNDKLTISSELIYRSVLNNDIIDPNWRVIMNLEYAVGSNQKLTFGFGKNFDGTITKDGNLVAALNFIKGFGAKRKM